MKKLILCCGLLMLLACQVQSFPEKFELTTIKVGSLQFQVQLAATRAQRAQGLMGQKPLQHGMLLLFDQPSEIVLWMKNTPSPLDVAFIDKDWRIIAITQMEPFSEERHFSPSPVIAALEMPQGWFGSQRVQVGTTVVYCQIKPDHCKED